ncbi:MAG: hypothetical protein ABNH53_07835 [Henriciella sp.]|jgi:hypothetical protein
MDNLESRSTETQTQPEFDARWKSLTLQGNTALKAGHLDAAGVAYDQAYHEARTVFAEAWNGHALVQPHAPPMLIVSATNSANQRRASGNDKSAKDQLLSAVRIFTETLTSARSPESLKRGCAEHLPRLLADLTDNYTETQSIIEEAKSAALGFWKKSAN